MKYLNLTIIYIYAHIKCKTVRCSTITIFWQQAAFISLCQHVSDEGYLLMKYSNCTTPNDLLLYLMCCGAVSLLYMYVYIYIYNTKLNSVS